ncbi:MAG: choice-of-anchor D domain-containing protein, partial [Terracidiphilus sp.]
MRALPLRAALWSAALICTVLFASTAAFAQMDRVSAPAAKPVIELAPSPTPYVQKEGEASFENAPANFHAFASARVGEIADEEQLTLNFSASTQLTHIESTKDFVIDPASGCQVGNRYAEGESCTLLVRFTPQGAGRRLGKLTVSNTASPQPMAFGLGGSGYAPIISFTPAIITTVPASHPSNVALLSGAQNLAVDGSDSLYVADSGNDVIRYMDSSGNFKSLATTSTAPLGIAVDTFGEVYFDTPSTDFMYEVFDYGPVVQASGTGTDNCPSTTPCELENEALATPGMMSIDPDNNLFFADNTRGAALSTVQPLLATLIYLYDPFTYQTTPSSAMAVDAGDNLYSLWYDGGECEIAQQSLYNAEIPEVIFNKIAGGHTCGFSGDGGQAGNAEIGSLIGQMAFDILGNLYFSDTNNQRVRRIDYTTGQINTIAGNGTAGYTGDGGDALFAELNTPTGVAVDSQGQVYIISSAGLALGQIIRKLGPNGQLGFGTQLRSTSSAAHLVTVANTGNSAMTLTRAYIGGTNTGDYKIDPNTTSCNLTAGATLAAGQSCKVGIIFTPAAAGTRSASLIFLDNTVTNMNTVGLAGTGTLPLPTFTITAPASSATETSGTAFTFSVSVTSSGTQPTGTVTMLLNGTAISGSPATLNGSGVASLSVTSTKTGSNTLSATYNGD